MKTKTKMLLGVAGLATVALSGKACYDNITLIDGSLDHGLSAVWRLGPKDYVIVNNHNDLTSRSLNFNLDYSTYYNNGWLTCSSGPSHPTRWRKDFSLGNQVIELNINSYFENPGDFFPCMYSNSFHTYKKVP